MLPNPEHLKNHPELIPETVEQSLTRAREGEDLRAFVALFDERARNDSIRVRDALLRGESLPLGGWIIGVKDNIAVKGQQLTCASRLLKNFRSPFTATAVERLEKAGAIILGKTNLDEFAMGSSSENSIFGAVRNPHDRSRVAGGSSGGSAVAVAAGWVHGALGSETGGSVRQPAAFCGVAGLKPTYGRISRYGLVAFGSSLDQIGQFASSCRHIFDLLCVMSGVDRMDSSSAHMPPPVHNGGLRPLEKSLRIGIPREYFVEGLSAEIRDAIYKVVEQLRSIGHQVIEVSLPYTQYAIPVYYIVATAEASSNLARYDGARYGWRHPDAASLADLYESSRGDGFGSEVRRRIMMGTFVLSAGYYDAYYRKGQQVRRCILDDYQRVFLDVDVLLTPTTPTTAFHLGEKIDDPLAMYLSDIFTAPANLAGVPALSIPIGKDGNRLPIGVQIQGPHFSEELILRLGDQIESLDKAGGE
ncbi:Asp-tRNA(Asn)/Glu-tRNA(Gln) amidotransferase subunit GatA [candidate division KSB1 bacterium]|nr:MAG: Asp-tRNA(Asn)/Glu-tRNA(Gln) amidotransferase subunit GatA [candidate division KSB1 bacterium]